jgi:hypothetical protein
MIGKREAMAINVAFRMANGVGGLLSPAAMGRAMLAADTPERPDARLFVRGFSAHQIGVAALGVAGFRWRSLGRPAAIAAVAIDAADVLSAVVEARQRGAFERDLVGGAIFSLAGIVTAIGMARR